MVCQETDSLFTWWPRDRSACRAADQQASRIESFRSNSETNEADKMSNDRDSGPSPTLHLGFEWRASIGGHHISVLDDVPKLLKLKQANML